MIKPLIASCLGDESVLFCEIALHQNNGDQPPWLWYQVLVHKTSNEQFYAAIAKLPALSHFSEYESIGYLI